MSSDEEDIDLNDEATSQMTDDAGDLMEVEGNPSISLLLSLSCRRTNSISPIF